MVLDTSALVAVLTDEPDASRLESAFDADPVRLLSAASLLELTIVIETRYGRAGGAELDLLLYKAQVEVVPVDVEQAELAREAWRRFGKGRHPAGLNYGDCFAYALAKQRGQALLFKGDDFGRTDVAVVPT